MNKEQLTTPIEMDRTIEHILTRINSLADFLLYDPDFDDAERVEMVNEIGQQIDALSDGLIHDEYFELSLKLLCELIDAPLAAFLKPRLVSILEANTNRIRTGVPRTQTEETLGRQAEALLYLETRTEEPAREDMEQLLGFVSDHINDAGLNSDKLIEAWLMGNSAGAPAEMGELIARNISTIQTLEALHPGSSKVLNEDFNIHHFGRWPTELLVRQYEQRDNTTAPYGAIEYAMEDHDGALYQHKAVYARLAEALQEYGCELRICETRNKLTIRRQEHELTRKYGQINFGIISGHGSWYDISFGNEGARGKLTMLDFNDPKHPISDDKKFFVDNPTLILASCSTGEENGVGQDLSEALDATVIAPDRPTTLRDIQVQWVSGSEDNKLPPHPVFTVTYGNQHGYGQAIARAYVKGVPREDAIAA